MLKSRRVNPMCFLPPETFRELIYYIPYPEILVLRLVCRAWKKHIDEYLDSDSHAYDIIDYTAVPWFNVTLSGFLDILRNGCIYSLKLPDENCVPEETADQLSLIVYVVLLPFGGFSLAKEYEKKLTRLLEQHPECVEYFDRVRQGLPPFSSDRMRSEFVKTIRRLEVRSEFLAGTTALYPIGASATFDCLEQLVLPMVVMNAFFGRLLSNSTAMFSFPALRELEFITCHSVWLHTWSAPSKYPEYAKSQLPALMVLKITNHGDYIEPACVWILRSCCKPIMPNLAVFICNNVQFYLDNIEIIEREWILERNGPKKVEIIDCYFQGLLKPETIVYNLNYC
ncbi:hypothetical protein V1525DRAFT_402241 [Lipomyces kononenkoae]|uniref:Uncharacterized protein n=1 Tax=Lipomyces kononenkoae TaxID=34357 RepID=A0ACC3T290_LIPKO